jgi:hypothetical protein
MATAHPAHRAAGSSTVRRPPPEGAPLRPHALLAERRTKESSTGRRPPWGGAPLRLPSPTPAHHIRTRHIRAHPPARLPTTSATARRRIHTLVPAPPGPPARSSRRSTSAPWSTSRRVPRPPHPRPDIHTVRGEVGGARPQIDDASVGAWRRRAWRRCGLAEEQVGELDARGSRSAAAVGGAQGPRSMASWHRSRPRCGAEEGESTADLRICRGGAARPLRRPHCTWVLRGGSPGGRRAEDGWRADGARKVINITDRWVLLWVVGVEEKCKGRWMREKVV